MKHFSLSVLIPWQQVVVRILASKFEEEENWRRWDVQESKLFEEKAKEAKNGFTRIVGIIRRILSLVFERGQLIFLLRHAIKKLVFLTELKY